MRRLVRTFIAALVALVVTTPVFAQDAPQPRTQRPERQQRLTPEQRQSMRQGMRGRPAVCVARIFKRLDMDGNGWISRQEWTRRPGVFDLLDANKDGQLTRDELRRAQRRAARRIR